MREERTVASPDSKIEIGWKTRLCTVDDEFGAFQIWVPSDPPLAVVEFSDGVRQVAAEKIKFCDEDHQIVVVFEKLRKEDGNAGRQDQGGG